MRMANRALTRGIHVAHLLDGAGRFGEYLRGRLRKGRCDNIRLYGDMLFVFDGKTLITAVPVPTKYRAEMNALRERHMEILGNPIKAA